MHNSDNFDDQATGLRKMNKQMVKVISISGGKGGVGKTNVSLNLAMALAQLGKSVMVLDADLGLANCDVMLGLRVEKNLSHVLSGEVSLDDIIIEGPFGIKIIPATSGSQSMTELAPAEHAGLIRAFSEMQTSVDVLLVDTAAGISDMVLSFSRASQDVMVVVCDEPSSITDAYALMKILSRDHGVDKFKIVANMVRSIKEGQELFSKLTRVTDRFLNVNLELVATIPYDENVRKAARKQKAFIEVFPKTAASMAIKSLALKANKWPLPDMASGHLEFFLEQLIESHPERGLA